MTDIIRRRGDTYPLDFLITTGEGEDEIPLDITGCTFLLTVDPNKAPTDDSSNICQIVGTVIDGPNGEVRFEPSDTDFDTIGKYYYDIQMTDVAGKIRTPLLARLTILQDITKEV